MKDDEKRLEEEFMTVRDSNFFDFDRNLFKVLRLEGFTSLERQPKRDLLSK